MRINIFQTDFLFDLVLVQSSSLCATNLKESCPHMATLADQDYSSCHMSKYDMKQRNKQIPRLQNRSTHWMMAKGAQCETRF